MPLSEEMAQYLQDPRFEQMIKLAEEKKPSPTQCAYNYPPQVTNNVLFAQQGWEACVRSLRQLKNPKIKNPEPDVTYGN